MEKLRLGMISDYSNHNCVNKAYQDFVAKSLSAVYPVPPIKHFRKKSDTKPWFGSDV